jgi:hypothetical protein
VVVGAASRFDGGIISVLLSAQLPALPEVAHERRKLTHGRETER